MKIPSGEDRCVTYLAGGNELFVMTSKFVGGGTVYTLYKNTDGDYERLGRGPSPLELETKFHIREAITQ